MLTLLYKIVIGFLNHLDALEDFTFAEKGNQQLRILLRSGYTWVSVAYTDPAVAADPAVLGLGKFASTKLATSSKFEL